MESVMLFQYTFAMYAKSKYHYFSNQKKEKKKEKKKREFNLNENSR